MKKVLKSLNIFMVMLSFMLVVLIITTILLKYGYLTNQGVFIKTILIIASFILLITFIHYVILWVLRIKNGFNNSKNCGIDFFEELDSYKNHWKESNEYYVKQIQLINKFYDRNDKVNDGYFCETNLGDLFARKAFLDNRISMYSELQTTFYSFIVSIIASIFINGLWENDNTIILTIIGLVVIASFAEIILGRYAERGHNESYLFQIDEYEKAKLAQVIREIEERMTISDDDLSALRTKRVVIDYLLKRKKQYRHSQKKKIIEDIEKIEKINLFIKEDIKKYKERRIKVGDEECILLYDKELGKANNYMGRDGLANTGYSELYAILCRCRLIDECNDCYGKK